MKSNDFLKPIIKGVFSTLALGGIFSLNQGVSLSATTNFVRDTPQHLTPPLVFSTEKALANPNSEVLPTLASLQGTTLQNKAVSHSSSHVMPSTAKIAGYSLTDMAQQLAYFSTSGNNPAYLPQTPFQILYIQNWSTYTGSFTVRPGTHLFMPLGSFDDSPPVIGTFPSDLGSAQKYVFYPDQVGAKYEVVVDGVTTSIGPSYVAGPVYTPGLLDGGGSHFIQVGVFLTPLSPGNHTITGRLSYTGKAFQDTYGVPSYSAEFTYSVTVQ